MSILVQAAIDGNKIPEAQKDQYLALAKADYETTKKVLDGMQSYQTITSQLKAGAAAESEKLVKEWNERHKAGTLEALKAENPDHFEALRGAFIASVPTAN